ESSLADDRVDFEVPLVKYGDVFDRYIVRVEEMRQAHSLVEQALNYIEKDDSPLMAYESEYVMPPHMGTLTTAEDMQRHFVWVIKGFSPPVGEVYQAIEHGKGEYGIHIVSAGSVVLNRIRVRRPDVLNLRLP